MKYKVYTDRGDLDGAGGHILAKLAYGDNVDIEEVYYDDVDDKIIKLFQSGKFKEYDKVFMVDMSIKDVTAEYIDSIKCNNLTIFDHHASALRLCKYNWCNIVVSYSEDKKACGTSLFYDYLLRNGFSNTIGTFVSLVRYYDTWDWKRHGVEDAYVLNRMYKVIGRKDFIKKMCYVLSYGGPVISELDRGLVNLFEKKLKEKIEAKNKIMIRTIIDNYKAGIVFIDGEASEIGNGLLELNPDLDFIAMFIMDYGTVSLRSKSEDIDISKIAERFGGGGHKSSAGFEFNTEFKEHLIERVFQLNGEN